MTLRILTLLALCVPVTAFAQVRPIYDSGASAMARQLARLQTTASVLHTGAHPDDEDSALVAWHARGENARTAYLSLTRGAGGQNLIGPEQSELLGVIRTEELLQARRLDGAEQLFTRAVDYGFSKHRNEAGRVWNEQLVLGDMVRAIRRFRPDVVVSRFTGTPTDGHGHHQFVGYLTPLAVAAAADARRFSEHLDEGLTPWRVRKSYVAVRGVEVSEREPLLAIDTGSYDPVEGRSYFEIGMHGRSQQKTQSMGQIEFRGRQTSVLRRVGGDRQAEESVFDGLDTSLAGIARFESAPHAELDGRLAELDLAVREAQRSYDAFAPQALVPVLARSLGAARSARSMVRHADAERLLDEKIDEIQSALVLAAGVVVDVLAETETVAPGGRLDVAVRLYDPGLADVEVATLALAAPAGWEVVEGGDAMSEHRARWRDAPTREARFEVRVPTDARPTSPYWLERPAQGAQYDWSAAGAAANLPFRDAPLVGRVALLIGGEEVIVRRDVEHRALDRVRGELRRRVDVVPPVSVAAGAELLVVSTSASDRRRELPLSIANHTDGVLRARLRVDAPRGWDVALGSADVEIPPFPASVTVPLEIGVPADADAGRYRLSPVVAVGGQDYRQAMHVVAYPHISTHRVYEPADLAIEVVDLEVAPVAVGYVMGSGDLVPAALRQLNVDVTLLDDEFLQTGELGQFDAIVVGIRASQARPAFVANNGRLLDYARAGGTLIVQYQQPDYIDKGLAPFPAAMDRSVRVVDETAAVEMLRPEHAVFTYPNRIRAQDFDGWVQERNNYNFTSYDESRYLPLTESHDPGEAPSTGAMLYAPLGEGHFVYTSYSWFRQLPNGVPGAYRLFANLISLPEAPVDSLR